MQAGRISCRYAVTSAPSHFSTAPQGQHRSTSSARPGPVNTAPHTDPPTDPDLSLRGDGERVLHHVTTTGHPRPGVAEVMQQGKATPVHGTPTQAAPLSLPERLELERKLGITAIPSDTPVDPAFFEPPCPEQRRQDLEKLFPPAEGFRVTEANAYAEEAYPPEVLRDKIDLLQRHGVGVPRSGVMNAWGPEQMDCVEAASFSMTPSGAREFKNSVETVQRLAGLTQKEAVAWVQEGKPSTEEDFKRFEAIQDMREEATYSPYREELGLREAVAAEFDTAASLLREEGLITSASDPSSPGSTAARRELLASAPPAASTADRLRRNPLRFFLSSRVKQRNDNTPQTAPPSENPDTGNPPEEISLDWRGSRAPAEAVPGSNSFIEEEGLDELFADDSNACVPQGGGTSGVSVGDIPDDASLPEAATLETPESLQSHLRGVEENLEEKRSGLREKNLKALRTARPITSGIPGGSHAAAMTRHLLKEEARKNDPALDERVYAELSKPSGHRLQKTPLHDPKVFTASLTAELAAAEDLILSEVMLSYTGSPDTSVRNLSSLSSNFIERVQGGDGGGAQMHPWHFHCIKLLLKLRADEAAAEVVKRCSLGGEAARRLRQTVMLHDRRKLEKLTSVMGEAFYSDFWASVRALTGSSEARAKKFYAKMKKASVANPQLALAVAVKENPALQSVYTDYYTLLSNTTREARILDASSKWAEADSLCRDTIGSFDKFSTDSGHRTLVTPVGSATSLIAAIQRYSEGLLQWAWSALILRRSRLLDSPQLLEEAHHLRTTSLQGLTEGQVLMAQHGLSLLNPMQHDHYVRPDPQGDDGSAIEMSANHASAGQYYAAKSRGLEGDRIDSIAHLLRRFDVGQADLATVEMMRSLEASKGALILEWPSRSAQHRISLWHRYMASLNMSAARLWRPYAAYPRGVRLVSQALASSQIHSAEASLTAMVSTGESSSDSRVTAALRCHEMFRAMYEGLNECNKSFWLGPPRPDPTTTSPWETAVRSSNITPDALKAAQAEALHSLSESDDGACDDDSWTGLGTHARWYVVLASQSSLREAWEEGHCRPAGPAASLQDAEGADLPPNPEVWERCFGEMEGVHGSAAEGAEKAFARATLALLMSIKPGGVGGEARVADLKESTRLASGYIEWLARVGDRRAILDQRHIWLHVLAVAVWSSFELGGAYLKALPGLIEQLESSRVPDMRYLDAVTLRSLREWLQGYLTNPEPSTPSWRQWVLFGSAEVYLPSGAVGPCPSEADVPSASAA
eukprot:TRINITY_DN24710_c0_g1_i1.p1 TRINITY_DN24710_c0_g1~~TRINITY_DN24710_c0_g1_i1.p1  ORF type:complete len:1266 (+),score=278.95 TRINITY_DN24710_c0_g1_i1:130-3927(+)